MYLSCLSLFLVTLAFSVQFSSMTASLFLVGLSLALALTASAVLASNLLFLLLFILVFVGGLLVLLLSVASLSVQDQGTPFYLSGTFLFLILMMSSLISLSVTGEEASITPSVGGQLSMGLYLLVIAILILGLLVLSYLMLSYKGGVRKV